MPACRCCDWRFGASESLHLHGQATVIPFHKRGLKFETRFTFQIPKKQHSYQQCHISMGMIAQNPIITNAFFIPFAGGEEFSEAMQIFYIK